MEEEPNFKVGDKVVYIKTRPTEYFNLKISQGEVLEITSISPDLRFLRFFGREIGMSYEKFKPILEEEKKEIDWLEINKEFASR